MSRIIRNVFVTRHGGVIGHDDSTDEDDEKVTAALRTVVARLGKAKVQALVAALEDGGPGDEGEEDEGDDEHGEIANSAGLPSMRLLLREPDKKGGAQ